MNSFAEHGFLQSFIDFFYLTTDKIPTPSYVTPSQKMLEDIDLNKLKKQKLSHSEDSLTFVSNQLVDAEDHRRQDKI